jgi:signal transduction histidine kinase
MYVWQLDFQRRLITYTSTLSKPEYVCTFDEYNASICNDSGDALIRGQNPEKLREPFVLQRRFARPMVHNTDAEGERWYQVMGVGVTDDNNQVTGAFGLFRDITNLIHTQQRLREETARAEDSGRQKSMFLASMTHELRTPLNSIVGFSDLLGSADSPEERHEFIRIIRNNCDMLLRLINDILEASTIDDGPQSVNPTDVDFAKAFDDICQSLEHRVQTPGVSFIKENPYTTLPARIDIDRIRQVVTNFVTNSVKYTKEGHIKVGYRQKDGGLYIYCEDTGLGIPKEKQASVFERFVKLNEFVQGTGLGLSICKSIAERCGGRIGVDSEGEGHGSTFWIWVPVG